jgi:hypothetical protein
MTLARLFERLKGLALCLSVLALCSALMAPASALAQEAGSGKWSGLCAAAVPDSHGQADDDDHCGLCLLPALALPGLDRTPAPLADSAADPQRLPRSLRPVQQSASPSIRGPPHTL